MIEKLKYCAATTKNGTKNDIFENQLELTNKINEIIDFINGVDNKIYMCNCGKCYSTPSQRLLCECDLF